MSVRNVKNNLIPFTQYLLPNGRRQDVEIEMDPETCAKAQQIIDRGYVFEAEVLMNGMCSFTIMGYKPEWEEDSDVAMALCLNGPKVPETIKKMIMDFDLNKYQGNPNVQ